MLKRTFILGVSMAYVAARSAAAALLAFVGVVRPPRQPVVLTYHAVEQEALPRFERQMKVLRACVSPTFAESVGRDGNCHAVAVTFDDALQSVFDNALPLLARYGIPATIFAPTGHLGGVAGWIRPSNSGRALPEVVSPSDLARVDPDLVRIESHTVSHPHLAQQPRSTIACELVDSKRLLEQITGRSVTELALPYGSGSDEVYKAAAEAGYQRVYANVPIRARREGECQIVGRVNVTPDDWPWEFRLKIAGGYQWLAHAIALKRYLAGVWPCRFESRSTRHV